MAGWTLTLRAGPRVTRAGFGTLPEAMSELRLRLDDLAPDAGRMPVDLLSRRIQPVAQVSVRAEIVGPGGMRASVRGGVDMRGDGSTEAFVGRIRRRLVQQRPGEDACDALRRALTDGQAPGAAGRVG